MGILPPITSQFITTHSEALLLHLDCGLDSRCERVAPAGTRWIDLDMPDVIGLAFDAFSKLTADRVQAGPSLQKTGWLSIGASTIPTRSSFGQQVFISRRNGF